MDLHNEGRQHVMDRMGEIGQALSPKAQVWLRYREVHNA